MQENILSLKNISIGYEELLLEGFNLDLKAGDMLAVIGPNGCGKSALLKTILGVIPPLKGQRNLLGMDNPKADQLNSRVSYIPQRLSLNPQIPLSVFEFLQLKLDKNISEKDIDATLDKVGLLDKKFSSIHRLSGGQMQRVFISFALLGKPKLICLDEATEGMDIESESMFFKLLADVVKENDAALIFISHDVAAVSEKANRVICMKKGAFFDGDPKSPDFHSCLHDIYGDDKVIHEHKH